MYSVSDYRLLARVVMEDGIGATRSGLPAGVYDRLGVPYDVKALTALRPGSSRLLFRPHGARPPFDLADTYPVDAVNWHDREAPPSLADALGRARRGLIAGISRMESVAKGRPEEAAAEVRDAITQTEGRRLCVGPGCAALFITPLENLLAARKAVKEVS
jgi:uroporphyrinogen decarboxylase